MSWDRVGIYHCKGRKLEWLVRWYGEINPETPLPDKTTLGTKIGEIDLMIRGAGGMPQ